MFPAVVLTVLLSFPGSGETRWPEVDSRPPQWIDFGQDDQHRHLWLRLQHDPRYDTSNLFEFYADGRLVKQAWNDSESFFLNANPATVAKTGGNWLLFFDSHPGAGDTWFTNYLIIRRHDLRFIDNRQFEHGDASQFQKTGRFYEYNYLKYQGDRRFWRRGDWGYRIVEWAWNADHLKFRRIRQWYALRLPHHLSESWDEPDQQLHGTLVGSLTSFRPTNLKKFGLPEDSRFFVMPAYGFGNWTVGLVGGKIVSDELNLIHGVKDRAVLDYPIGDPDPHHPPQLERTSQGLRLTLTTCVFRKIRVSKFLITTQPYKMTLQESHLEPEWTPFGATAN